MFKKNEFRAAMARKEISTSELAKELGLDPATLFRKISGQSDFYRNEIEKICTVLELSPQETLNIFLPKTLLFRNTNKGGEDVKDFMKDYLPVAGVGLAAGFVAGILVYAWAYFAVVGG